MKRTFAAMVEHSSNWQAGTPPQEQPGFAAHAQYMAGLEAEGFIALAGLMKDSGDVLFIFRADSEAEVRRRVSQDPWQMDGHVRLVRVEEIAVRIGLSPQAPPAGTPASGSTPAETSRRSG